MKDHRLRIRLIPSLRQRRRKVKARIALNEPVENQLINMLRLHIRAYSWIKARRATLDQKHHRPRIALRGLAPCHRKNNANKNGRKENLSGPKTYVVILPVAVSQVEPTPRFWDPG